MMTTMTKMMSHLCSSSSLLKEKVRTYPAYLISSVEAIKIPQEVINDIDQKRPFHM